ncbi:flagellar biosynthetic protein FliR [Limoniibacter endophyticus]|uniref:Flagellar biosynthetic protein FliR n=1 Tax=Limoniibacter endophyticus TaxID=1565040 RepID=A0A8J3DLI8_9HYPH|nr:flagellar biosynthetic protein FliR [Limoniibacter endophyticus]GHC64446.1 flagellar biosynthetic protein FliR [Limoniibacter endophyticus]
MNASLEQLVLAAMIAFCRVGSCFLLMPGFSSIRLPAQIRLFIAVAASLTILMMLSNRILPFVDSRPAILLPLMASEIMIGGLIGLLTRVYLLAIQFMGSAIAMTMGFNNMVGTAIEEPEPQAAITTLISFSVLLVLFTFDFHHEVIRALIASYDVAPLQGIFPTRASLIDLTDTLGESFMVALRLGSPFIAYGLLVNLAIGFINKLTPQIPIYFISLPFVIAGGLVLLYFAVPTFLSLAADSFIPTTIGR